MFDHGRRSQLTSASQLQTPGVGTYDVASRRSAAAVQANWAAFNCTGQRSELTAASSSYPALPHAYSPVLAPPPARRGASPSFGCTAVRPSLVAPGAWALPGPGAYDLAGAAAPRGSPLTVPRRTSPRRRAVSVATLVSLRRSAPSIPYAAPPATAPSPAEYTLPRPATSGGGANVLFGRSRAPRMRVEDAAARASPGPGTFNPGFATGVGGVYKTGVPLSSLARPASPGGAFCDRSAGLVPRDAADTPGPGQYLGPWGGSGFLAAARRDVPEALQFLGSRAPRGDMTQWAGSAAGSPGPGAYGEGALLRPPSPPRASPLGGSEARFRLPPDEAAARANPGPGAYGPSGWAGLMLPSARRRGAGAPSPPPPPPRMLSEGTAAALLGRALVAAGDAPPPPAPPPSPAPPSRGGSRPPTRASPLAAERARSPGPIYDTSAPLGGRGFNAAAVRGALMGLGAERGAGGAMAAVAAAAEGPGPGAYDLPRAPLPLPARPLDMGPLPQASFGRGRRAELGGGGGEGGEYTNPVKPWAFERSFNAKAFAPVSASS
jgi:hypothetical protein